MSVCCECCVLSGRGLCDDSCRGVLPTVTCRYVRSRNPKNKEGMAGGGQQREKNCITISFIYLYSSHNNCSDQMKKDERGDAYDKYGGEEN